MWWPPYHWPFQIVKPSWPNRSARKVWAARSTVRGCQTRYTIANTTAMATGATCHQSIRLSRERSSRSGSRARGGAGCVGGFGGAVTE